MQTRSVPTAPSFSTDLGRENTSYEVELQVLKAADLRTSPPSLFERVWVDSSLERSKRKLMQRPIGHMYMLSL